MPVRMACALFGDDSPHDVERDVHMQQAPLDIRCQELTAVRSSHQALEMFAGTRGQHTKQNAMQFSQGYIAHRGVAIVSA